MSTRPFGSTQVEVPKIGLGTWQMEGDDRASAVAALRAGLDAGMTHVDTAELYGSGRVEELVAEAIAGRRDEIFLVSKVLPTNASRKGTLRACEASLRRLRTDRLDCYLLHWPGSHPLEDTLAAFEELVTAGKIKSYGVSNFDEEELEAAVAIVGRGRIACNQVLFHLEERRVEHAVVPYCEERGIAIVGYTPFGRAAFPPPRGAAVLNEIARQRGVTPRQVALAFLTRRPGWFAIPKSASAVHTRENAGALGLELDAAAVSALDAAFPRGKQRRGVATL
ncbi:MAG TPA: aldo/keto reductase [Polyangiaceae bacterium]|jgi:diketogulonate reductase-like aldo/keto reductase|nr:aldo/keto reductase [Polyangiaceae bacterium]